MAHAHTPVLYYAYSVKTAAEGIMSYLEDMGTTAHKAIYFDGWNGLADSVVLRDIVEHPTPSLKEKFDKIIHINCSRWKGPRALQRAIVNELNLPQRVTTALDRQDIENDFSEIDQVSRSEIAYITWEIYQTISNLRWLVIFHNKSDNTVNLAEFGFSLFNWSLTPNKVLWTFRGRLRLNPKLEQKVDSSHFINQEIAAMCILYLLWLNAKGSDIINYDWGTHASNYWVCDGIIQDGQFDEPWEASAALLEQIRIEDCSSHEVTFPDDYEYTQHWNSVAYTSESGGDIIVSQKFRSFFLAPKDVLYIPLPPEMFRLSERLLFYSPPFNCCHSLRFLGLEHCKDLQEEEEDKQGRPVHTDWDFDLSQDIIEHMAVNIREVHVKKGRIWRNNLMSWGLLKNLRKLRVIEPTCSWETGKNDEFIDMVKLELLDLSGDCTIQVLPSLSTATSLKTLVLDGSVELDHVGPEGLPPLLETFSLDASSNKLSKISLEGCARLENFLLRGAFPGLEELNLSGTAVQRVNLSDMVVRVEGLRKVFLMGCKRLRAILWWKRARQHEVLCVGTLETEVTCPRCIQHESYSLLLEEGILKSAGHLRERTMIASWLYLDLHVPPTTSKSKWPKSRDEVIIPKPCCYSDVLLDGISLTDVESDGGIQDIYHVMRWCINSLHVHDNSCILEVAPKGSFTWYIDVTLKWCRVERCPNLETVFVTNRLNNRNYSFRDLETIWASDLPAAQTIWSKETITPHVLCFDSLQSIHLQDCPRLMFAVSLLYYTYFPRLQTLHISHCGALRQIFPWDAPVTQEYRAHNVKEFPKLKHTHLYDLANLQEICEAKMLAPMLESVTVRGCWGLKRLRSVDPQCGRRHRPVVHGEKDWLEKLEWDGLHAGHHPSLYEPQHSSYSYYKKRHLRGTVLR
ncbi:hypothetical protein BS78_06G027500 [Paspalum vaginatum]|nr:hypothetical protein BS78_06G027500 [Paspalum vaginatum]